MALSYLKRAALITLLASLGACATPKNQADISQQQDEALQRWVSCVDRQVDTDTVSNALIRVDQYCEGHKRDLLAAYPVHLEKKLNAALVVETQNRATQKVATVDPADDIRAFSVTLK
jgi:hypothetical protein